MVTFLVTMLNLYAVININFCCYTLIFKARIILEHNNSAKTYIYCTTHTFDYVTNQSTNCLIGGHYDNRWWILFRPAEMQYYTSVASILIMVPTCLLLMNVSQVMATLDWTMVVALVANGVFFHYQTITAFCLMWYISPVTHRYCDAFARRVATVDVVFLNVLIIYFQ